MTVLGNIDSLWVFISATYLSALNNFRCYDNMLSSVDVQLLEGEQILLRDLKLPFSLATGDEGLRICNR